MSERQRMDIKSFRALGYLQELNRRFLHLFGLALEVVLDKETGKETLGGIWEVRDPDGIIFDLENSDEERRRTFLIKKKYIDSELEVRARARQKSLGFVVEPVPGDGQEESWPDDIQDGIVDAYDYHIAEMYFSVSSPYEASLYAHEKHDECMEVFGQWRWITGSNTVEETDKAIGWIK